jgi:hypothetical protein
LNGRACVKIYFGLFSSVAKVMSNRLKTILS